MHSEGQKDNKARNALPFDWQVISQGECGVTQLHNENRPTLMSCGLKKHGNFFF